MTCEWIKTPNGPVMVCSPRKRPSKCSKCGRTPAVIECDFPTPSHKSGTCDKKLCAYCAVHVGDDLDYCRDHKTKQAMPATGDLFK